MFNMHDRGAMIADEAGTSDPLQCNAELPLRGCYYPLGFTVHIETNSREVLQAAEESWAEFEYPLFPAPPVTVRIGVTDDGTLECPPEPGCRAQRHLLSNIADAHNFAVCDLGRAFAFAWLTHSAVAHRHYLRYHFLEATALVLIASSYATPLHAASISHAGRGVLLCGNSGAGKSSLSYACARAGWSYISDDATYLLQDRSDRLVVGNPFQIRFRPSAVELFSELQGRQLTPRAKGKPSIELRTCTLPEIAIARQCQIDYIVFLNRQSSGPSRIQPYSRATAMEWFNSTFSMPVVRDTQLASIRRLLDAAVVEISYQGLDSAVSRLTELVEKGK